MNLGAFWGFLAIGETYPLESGQMMEVSCIGNCKFEFSTIKNHYKDIHNAILDKSLKKTKMGCF